MVDKRRRNARPSKYRPRTEAQKTRRRAMWEARTEERQHRKAVDQEADLKARMEELQTALRDHGHTGIHGRRNSHPLDDIANDAKRFSVLKARVERLEALWSIDKRKRETQGKIIIGGALLAEMIDAVATGDRTLMTAVIDILDRRVEAVRDRLTVKDLLGDAPLPLRPGGDPEDAFAEAVARAGETTPDFDALIQSAMAEEGDLTPSDVDPDYAELDDGWSLQA